MHQPTEPFRRLLLHLLRFGGLAVVTGIVLTACYTDVAQLPTPTAGSLSAVTNVPPTQAPTQVKPPPTQAGGGGDQQEPNGNGGGGGGGGTPAAQQTRQVLQASPPATASRTPLAPLGTRTPTRTGTSATTPSTVRTVPPGPATVRPTGITPPAGKTPTGGTTPSGITPPPGVTVSATTGSPVPAGLLLVTKHENFANEIVAGACFSLLSGTTTVASACDQTEEDRAKDPGVIGLEAPAGTYMLRETTPPSGYMAGADMPVEVIVGETRSVDVINHLISTPSTPPASGGGVIFAQFFGPDGSTPFANVCLGLTGPGTYRFCDNGEGDVDPSEGSMETGVIVAGDYTLIVYPPAGYEATEPPATLPVTADSVTQLTLTFREVASPTTATATPTGEATEEPTTEASPPTEEPTTETPTETPTGEATPPTEEPTPIGIVIAQVTTEDGATPLGGACLRLTGPMSYDACDDGVGDADLTPGILEIDNVAAGDYAVEVQAPANYEPAAEFPTSVRVDADQFAQLAFAFRAVTTTTTGSIRIDKVDATDGVTPLGGVCFDVTGGGQTIQVCDNGENDADETVGDDNTPGVIVLANVVAGDYVIHETQAPEGHEPGPDQSLHVDPGQPATVSIPNGTPTPPATGTLAILAVDADGNPVPSACFATTLPDGTPRDGCDDDNDGTVVFDQLPPGDYTVTQTSLPAGFEAADVTEQTTSVVADQTAEVRFTVRPAATTGTLVVTKVDAADGTTPLGNACFTATGADGTPVAACDDDGDGITRIEGLAPGDYTVQETTAPNGYLAGADQTATITAGAETPLTFADQAAPQTGTLTVVTVDPTGAPLAGACYEATGPDGATAQGCDDDNDGGVLLGDVVAGDWLVRQTTVPTGYDPSDPAEQTVAVVAGQPADVRFTIQQTPPAPGSLIVTKVNAADGTTPLPSACFSATGADGQPIELCDDDNDGTTRFADLVAGDYTVHETHAPEGYLPAADQTASVPAGGEATLTFADEAVPPPGTLTVLTLDPAGAAIPGACYSATGPNDALVEGCDDDGDGAVPLGEVAAGDWLVRQTTVPPGYNPADPAEQTVTVAAGQPAEARFANAPAAPEVGSVRIAVQDDQGQPAPGACVDLSGPQAIHACDDVENDADPTPGQILVQNVPVGDYTVTESQVPAGYRGADPQPVTVAAGAEAPLTFVNAKEPTGVPLVSPVVYDDDAGRLWLLRPNDPQPQRLDANEGPFSRDVAPVFAFDRTWIAYATIDPATGTTTFIYWMNLADLSSGGVSFAGFGEPTRLAWLPGRTDTLLVATKLPSGLTNVYLIETATSNIPAAVFPDDQAPASIEAIVPAPSGQLVAIQATGADGDRDVYLVDTANPTAPVPTNVGPNGGADPDDFVAWSPAGDRVLIRSGADPAPLVVTDMSATAAPLGTVPAFPGDANAGTAPQWAPDASVIAFFDGDPAAGGQLQLYATDGTQRCDPIANVRAADWSPTDNRLWALLAPPNEPVRLVAIDTVCGQQDITTFDGTPDKLLWAPNGGALALVDYGDTGTVVSLLVGDQVTPIDPGPAGVAITDILGWSPGGEMLALYAGGPSVSLWVVVPGSPTPVAVAGSTLPEGAAFVTRVWWGT